MNLVIFLLVGIIIILGANFFTSTKVREQVKEYFSRLF